MRHSKQVPSLNLHSKYLGFINYARISMFYSSNERPCPFLDLVPHACYQRLFSKYSMFTNIAYILTPDCSNLITGPYVGLHVSCIHFFSSKLSSV